MKIGSIVYASKQGLGYLARDFFLNGIITHPLVLEHSRHETHPEWFLAGPDRVISKGTLNRPNVRKRIEKHISEMDAMMFFETPFEWDILKYCKDNHIPTLLMPMYECTPKDMIEPQPDYPDIMLCPSMLDYDIFKEWHHDVRYLPVPVPRSINFKLRKTALIYVHNAGHGSFYDRNGTMMLLRAMKLIKSPIKLILRSQRELDYLVMEQIKQDNRIDLRIGQANYDTLYDEGDVFVFPETFNGLSLPLQEAYASGMAIIALDRHPVNTYIPPDFLVHVTGYEKKAISPRMLEFDMAITTPKLLAEMIDLSYAQDIEHLSLCGMRYGIWNSWPQQGPLYKSLLKRMIYEAQNDY